MLDAGRLQQLLLVVGGQKGQRGGDKIHQAARLFDIRGNRPQLIGERLRFADNLLELADDIAHQRFRAGVVAGSVVLQNLDLGDHEGFGLRIAHQPHPLHALGEDKAALVGHAHNLVHRGQRSHGVQIGRLGRVQPRVQLRRHNNRPLLAQRLDQLNGTLPAHGQGQHRMGKENSVADRQDGNPAHDWTHPLRERLWKRAGWEAGSALSVLVSTFLH